MAKPSIVFAHGLWADGSCFSKLIPALLAEGHEVMASQHGLDSLAGDVALVKACLARVSSPAILVGHSYGGTLITHAGTDPPLPGWSTSRRSRRMPTRLRRASRPSSR
jgi:pimeloyl-ACP methyl ester carboxylesterase